MTALDFQSNYQDRKDENRMCYCLTYSKSQYKSMNVERDLVADPLDETVHYVGTDSKTDIDTVEVLYIYRVNKSVYTYIFLGNLTVLICCLWQLPSISSIINQISLYMIRKGWLLWLLCYIYYYFCGSKIVYVFD